MQSSISVATLPLIEMAAVGHTLAQVPQMVHVSSLVTGETAIGRAPAASYGKVPGIAKSVREPDDVNDVTFYFTLAPNAMAF